MVKIKGSDLSKIERVALDKGKRDGKTYHYHMRYRTILLKVASRHSKEVAKEVGWM